MHLEIGNAVSFAPGQTALYLTVDGIMARYDCGRSKAYAIMRSISKYVGGLRLGRGKVLLNEIDAWETRRLTENAVY